MDDRGGGGLPRAGRRAKAKESGGKALLAGRRAGRRPASTVREHEEVMRFVLCGRLSRGWKKYSGRETIVFLTKDDCGK
jgi:hypothetical protein